MVSCLIYSKSSEEVTKIFMAIDTNYEMQILAYSKIACLFNKEENGIFIWFCQHSHTHRAIFIQVLVWKIVFW